MQSKKLSIDNQLKLPIGNRMAATDVPDDLIARQQSMTAAVNLCITASGLGDKEIYITLGIDPGHWTRIKQGKAHFPVDKLNELQDLCGNEIVLRWQNMSRGYRMVPIEDVKDQRIRELEQRVAEQTKEIETLIKYGVISKQT